jgi:hypothetical protein
VGSSFGKWPWRRAGLDSRLLTAESKALIEKEMFVALLAAAFLPQRPLVFPRHGGRVRAIVAGAANDDVPNSYKLEMLERCLHIANLEQRAEEMDLAGNLTGAADAYSQLLALQPPDCARRSAPILSLLSPPPPTSSPC